MTAISTWSATRGNDSLPAQFEVWEFDAPSAIEFGKIRAELRRAARPIPMFDILIASIARANNLTVVTADAHFEEVTGLKTANWLVTP